MEQTSKASTPFFSRKNIQSLVILASFVFAFRWSVASPYVVPTPSMEPSIKVGDRVLGNHLAYELRVPFTQIALLKWGKPKKGDIIIFKSQTDEGINLVKRIVATEGDEVAFRDGVLFINGAEQHQEDANSNRAIMTDMTDRPDEKSLLREHSGEKEHWVLRERESINRFRDWPGDSKAYKIPAGHVFVSGDNRDNSSDSRAWGPVPLADVYGRADRILWSAYFEDGSYVPHVRFARWGMVLE